MEVFIGTIQPFAFNFAPSGWQPCNGQTLAISQYSALFALIGVTYGGNGTTTFQLPNLQGRGIICQGTGGGGTYVMGEVAGSTSVTILANNMPQHTHPVAPPISNVAATSSTPAGGYPAVDAFIVPKGGSAPTTYSVGSYNTAATAGQFGPAFNTGPAGSSIPLNIQNPYLCMNYCICMNGLFPSRN